MLRFHSLRIAQAQMQAEDAVALALEIPPELAAEYHGAPGQHIVLRAALEGEEVRRTYSLVSAPGERLLRIIARVHPEGRLSRHLAHRVRPGDRLDVLPPNGSFTPHSAAAGRGCGVAFAAGCGITPIVSVARSWLESGTAGRVILFYGNRTMARAMCLEELLALKDRYLDRLALHFVMSREPQEVEIYNGRLDGEHVGQLARSFLAPTEVAEYFICGPGDMIDTVSAALHELGVPPDRIRAEHFTVATAASDSAAATAAASAGAGRLIEARPAGGPAPAEESQVAEVTILMDGRRRSFSMRMNAESVLDGAAKAGLELPFSCRAGVCSTCRTKVVRGEVAMTQNYALEDWELEQGYV
ncbi:MAG: 2Fe-2S iron-sulfur cluster-binding protein, partial [Steroidobacteraceae bacterium]